MGLPATGPATSSHRTVAVRSDAVVINAERQFLMRLRVDGARAMFCRWPERHVRLPNVPRRSTSSSPQLDLTVLAELVRASVDQHAASLTG